MKIRLSDVINKNCLQHGRKALEAFGDIGKLATTYPAVAAAVADDAERRSKPLTWALETARSYLENKLQATVSGTTIIDLTTTVSALSDSLEELIARVAKCESGSKK